MNFINSYQALGPAFYQRIDPEPVRAPRLFLWNQELAEALGLADELLNDPQRLAQVFSGNRLLPGSEPIALAYAGHQFGHFVPQLGDGRAHLLGDLRDGSGRWLDLQLKGSGRTAFSRNGDGRCALGPALREFIMSQALRALEVPSSQSLAVVQSGETVWREGAEPGALVTRVAASHLRVGSFEFFARRGQFEQVRTLADYAIQRHYPELAEAGQQRFIALLEQVIQRQVELVVDWLRVGFIHGVMNTDNTALS
ncbi:MAG: protein adenylyltransferase SelO family protein, partial [Gammaproteobacteria bacterium SHHR-1]